MTEEGYLEDDEGVGESLCMAVADDADDLE